MAGIGIKQNLKMSQQLMMTPQLQQAIKLLQLSRLELEEFVAQQLEENPVLEEGNLVSREEERSVEKEKETNSADLHETRMQEAGQILDSQTKDQKNEIDWESYSKQGDNAAPIPSTQRSQDEEAPNYENMVSRKESLSDYLLGQVGELNLTEREFQIATLIIGNLDERGFLSISLQEIAETLGGITVEDVEDILDPVQRLDPPGIAARDLRECLLNQLRFRGDRDCLLFKIISSHMRELENRNYPVIARALKVSVSEVHEAVSKMLDLEPVPARNFVADDSLYIVPDIYIFKIGENWLVALNEEGLPRLMVSDLYRTMLDDKGKIMKSEEKDFVAEKVRAADWLIKSIQQRQKTIFLVTECILKRQKEFFEKGVSFLKPMILRDIAEDLELSESTISRVTTNKYVHTPRGILNLNISLMVLYRPPQANQWLVRVSSR